MAAECWYAVSDSLDMYDTGTGWEYTVRHRGIPPYDYAVTEYRKSGGVATHKDLEHEENMVRQLAYDDFPN